MEASIMFGEHIFGSLNTVFASMQTQRWRSIGIVTPEETTYNKLNFLQWGLGYIAGNIGSFEKQFTKFNV